VPTNVVGGVTVSTQNWTINNTIVAYSKICTHARG